MVYAVHTHSVKFLVRPLLSQINYSSTVPLIVFIKPSWQNILRMQKFYKIRNDYFKLHIQFLLQSAKYSDTLSVLCKKCEICLAKKCFYYFLQCKIDLRNTEEYGVKGQRVIHGKPPPPFFDCKGQLTPPLNVSFESYESITLGIIFPCFLSPLS